MKIGTANLVPTPLSKQVLAKTITTLLELIKPLSPTQALVKSPTLGEIVLSIKEPLQTQKIYHAILEQKNETWTAKELLPLPQDFKKLVNTKAQLSIEMFIEKIAQGKSPEKIALESLNQQLIQAVSKEEIKDLLSQIIHILQSQEPLIPLSFKEDQGYVKFKKKEKKDQKVRLPFEAYFCKLGFLQGYVSSFKHQQELHISVQNSYVRDLLQSHAHALKPDLFVSVKENFDVSLQQSLLDIQA